MSEPQVYFEENSGGVQLFLCCLDDVPDEYLHGEHLVDSPSKHHSIVREVEHVVLCYPEPLFDMPSFAGDSLHVELFPLVERAVEVKDRLLH